MSNPNQCLVTVGAPPRSPSVQASVQFVAAEWSCTWSWGLQPARAMIDWVSASQQPAIIQLASMEIDTGGHTFYGICKSAVPVLGEDGITLMQEFVDNRDFLQWDNVRGAFNMADHRIVNGQFIRRYWHILPADAPNRRKSYTNTPYTAEQILDYLFDAPSVGSPWYRFYYSTYLEYTAMGTPIYDLDFMDGPLLGQAVVRISEAIGMVFTLIGGPYTLLWTVKGQGSVPAFPANSTNRRNGVAVTDNPTAVTVLGDRNKYQVLNCTLQPDWLPAWQNSFGLDFNAFVRDIFYNVTTEAAINGIPANTPYSAIPGDDAGNQQGWQLAAARARLLTVAQYAALRDKRDGNGNQFRDYRKFQGRSRLQMPVALYMTQIVWRAYCLPPGFTLRLANGGTADLFSLDLDNSALVEVTHDPVTGAMSVVSLQPPSSAHNGYVIVQGYQVGSDAFASLHPDYFNLPDWLSGQALWSQASFQTDDSGEGDEFILLDQPAFQAGDLINAMQINGVPQLFPDGRPRTALNAQAVALTPPPVQASLIFQGENFEYTERANGFVGAGVRSEIRNESGLAGAFITDMLGTQALTELPFVDGQTASQKAAALAVTLLNQQWVYVNGGYTVQGSNGTQLTSMIDRVTVHGTADDGLTEEVDFTSERARAVVYHPNGSISAAITPEREYDRVAQLDPLFPGQDELRVQARQMSLDAAVLRLNRAETQTISSLFHELLGLDQPPTSVPVVNGTSQPPFINVGAPIYREATSNAVTAPGSNVFTNPVFSGVTVRDQEDPSKPLPLVSSGVVTVRLSLAATDTPKIGDAIGMGSDLTAHDYVVPSPKIPIGILLDDWSSNAVARVVLTRVRLQGVGGPGGVQATPYNNANAYSNGAIVQITASTVVGGITTTPGVYVLMANLSVPANATGNQVPQFPPPQSGTQYWMLVAFGVISQQTCAGGAGSGQIYVNASGSF